MELGQRQADGATLREHLQRAVANGCAVEPYEPEIPGSAQSLWAVFSSLSATRAVGMAPSAISPRDVQAWCDLRGVRLTAWELDTLEVMDSALLAAVAKQQPKH